MAKENKDMSLTAQQIADTIRALVENEDATDILVVAQTGDVVYYAQLRESQVEKDAQYADIIAGLGVNVPVFLFSIDTYKANDKILRRPDTGYEVVDVSLEDNFHGSPNKVVLLHLDEVK